MRLFLTILLGKIVSYFTKLLKFGGGSAAPGLYALKIEPDLVEKVAGKIPQNIVITGTNGKTTTAKMLAHFAKASGLKIIRNHTGSNLERGIASTLIQDSGLHLRGVKLNFDLGIWELDEAAFNTVAPKLKPEVVVFLNVFRDQLDRYGEIDTIVKNWCATLQKLPKKTMVIVNGDDANTAKLKSSFMGDVYSFGVRNYKIAGETVVYEKEKENLNCEITNVKLKGLEGSSFSVLIHDQPYPVSLLLPGLYHIYDFLAAFYTGHELGFSTESMILSLKSYSPAFGRVEKLPFGYIFLIKNPAGATQVFETIAPNIKPNDRLLLALNDNIADGTDVSWIWDAQFELLQPATDNLQTICSGKRADDLAVRLKYTGFDSKRLMVEPDLKKAFREARKDLKGQLFILPTYTAMLELQSILTKTGMKNHYWKEEN